MRSHRLGSDIKAKRLKPLSLYGREGRELQRLLIDNASTASARNAFVAKTFLSETPPAFVTRLNKMEQRAAFFEELMNIRIIANFNRYLNTPEWEQLRESKL